MNTYCSPLAEVLPLTEVPSPVEDSEASPAPAEAPSTELLEVDDIPLKPLAANDGGFGAMGAKAGLRGGDTMPANRIKAGTAADLIDALDPAKIIY